MGSDLRSRILNVIEPYFKDSHGLEPTKDYGRLFRLFQEAWEENHSVVNTNRFVELLKAELDEKLIEQNKSKWDKVTEIWHAWEYAFKELCREHPVGSERHEVRAPDRRGRFRASRGWGR